MLTVVVSVGWFTVVCNIWIIFVYVSFVIMSHKARGENKRVCGFRKGHPAYTSHTDDSMGEGDNGNLVRWMPRLT